MLGARDFIWGIAIGVGLIGVMYYRPLYSARSFVDEQCKLGFQHAYAGHRYTNGELITPEDGGGAHLPGVPDLVKTRIMRIDAQEVSASGAKARFIVHHVVITQDGTPAGFKIATDLHVELERRDGRWNYTRVQPRGAAPLELQPGENPFTRAITEARNVGLGG